MANTFLNTGRSIAATSNPTNNIEQLNNNANNVQQPAVQQGVQNQNSQTNANNTINPITIPIQIQPQIASTEVQSNQNTPSNNIRSLQTNNVQHENTTNTAPTPQAYNTNNTNTNVVDFNQIYSSYQNAFGNNQSNSNVNSNSGIKKTSIGSTIVTPTNTNINTVQGQYQSAYADTINSLISKMLTQMNNGFQYNPEEDQTLQVATEYAANTTLQSLAGSGVLNSSATAERVARIVSELIPQYEEKAHNRWVEYLGQLADTAQIVMNYDSQQFEYWKDAKDREFQEKELAYQKQQDALENAWKRVDELGYVDNEASTILGVPVGTLSGEARLAKEQQEFELQKMREQLQIQYENDKALYELRAELDKEYASYEQQLNKEYAKYEQQLNKENMNYEYELQSKYSSSSNSNSNYERYDEIIQNRYAEQDFVTGQYVVPDEETYNELANYLDNLYASGQISQSDFLQLSAKYSKNPSISSITTTSIEPGLTQDNYSLWIDALDGNNSALSQLGVNINGQTKNFVNNGDVRNAVQNALNQIQNGTYKFTSNQQLMNDLNNGVFGKLGWGF